MPTFVLPGRSESDEAPGVEALKLESYQSILLAFDRDAAEETVDLNIADDAVVALRFEGGFKLWMRGEQLRRELGRPPSRDAGDQVWRLDSGLQLQDTERGAGAWLLKGLECFGLKPQAGAATAAAEIIERNNANVLIQLDPSNETGWRAVAGSMQPPAADQAVLLFLHGTFSSTQGSFGALFRNPIAMQRLRLRYPGGIYGFEHRTLTESPVQNALAVLDQLPTGVRLHLVSHSRGGLVGDLLALHGGADRVNPLMGDGLDAIGSEDQKVALVQFGKLLAEKRIRVEHFVRVASPSRGTTLASGRLDRWLSVLGHLLAATSGPGAVAVSGLLDFTLAVVQERTNPETLPGIEAMMPGSALVGLLNHPDLRSAGSLSVISGDTEPTGLWARLKMLLPDLYFAGDHDLVVNTGSMYGGPTYAQGRYYFDQGPDVNHIRYFTNDRTVGKLLQALGTQGAVDGFEPLVPEMQIEVPREVRAGSKNRPVLFVLPGIMGSALSAGGDPVWLDIGRLARGGLKRLRLNSADRVNADGLLAMAYGDLLAYFDQSHDVVRFPYDWRLSIEESAKELAKQVERKLFQAERHNKPVRLLVHSMGGLVARAMIAERPDLWQRIRRHPGGRLVMLGTPNDGSWEMVRVLVAQSATLKKLALLDLTHNSTELLEIISDFPGALELLPEDARDLFSSASWSLFHDQDQKGRHLWGVPGQRRSGTAGKTRLQAAADVRRRLRDRAIDPEGMIYVAGHAKSTPCDLEQVDEGQIFLGRSEKRLRFIASGRGDGQVLWDDGQLPGVPTWYMTGVEHGDLANHRAMFRALRDLLVDGDTDAMSRRPPVTRGARALFPMPEAEPAYYPDERSLLTSALGLGRGERRTQPPERVQVSVVHGDLANTHHMVAVGHYAGDTIVGPEAYLDRVLECRLRRSQHLGLYPGELGSHGLFFHPDQGRPQGAIVVGLGAVGELTPAALSATFSRALLAYANAARERSRTYPGGATDRALDLSLTTLLIGTGAGGCSVEESVRALLRGVVQANDTLQNVEGDCPQGPSTEDTVRIGTIEIVELWEEMAIQAGHVLAVLDRDADLVGRFACRPNVVFGLGGKSGSRRMDDPQWWHRLQIVSAPDGSLRFTSLTRRARAEQDLLATQQELVDGFVKDAIGSAGHGPEISRTLFEMLLPNRLKDGDELHRNLVLVIDQASARFPWEMLEDRWSDGREPPAVEHGVIRQLATQSFRDRPRMSARGRALVIGDPLSDYVPLAGAQKEAAAVQTMLEGIGYEVMARIRSRARDIVAALHADDYQILHLAGHGIHGGALASPGGDLLCSAYGHALPAPDDNGVSGMIIGTGTVLTPADVKQVRRVPELVFINCCHLGRSDQVQGRLSDPQQANRLAANLAVQFIEMGVRAVVAAGWAVDDGAAEIFSKTFYLHMGAGETFGESVRQARRATWNNNPGINTWGAYQCYGDPGFTIDKGRNREPGPASGDVYVSPTEAIDDLRNLQASAFSADIGDNQRLRAALSDIEKALERVDHETGEDWLTRGDLAEAMGLACGELGLFHAAVEQLDRAILASDARVSCWAIEQRARFQACRAKAMHESGDSDGARQEFDRAWTVLDRLQFQDEGGLSVERYRSLTSILTRRVQTLERTERKKDLERLVEIYDRAAEQFRQSTDVDPLEPAARLYWVTAKLMLTGYSRQDLATGCPDFDVWCADLLQRGENDADRESNFWNAVIAPEVRLLQALARGDLEDHVAGISDDIRLAMARGVSRRQLESLLNNLDLLYALSLDATVNERHFRDQVPALAEIRRAVLQRLEVAESGRA